MKNKQKAERKTLDLSARPHYFKKSPFYKPDIRLRFGLKGFWIRDCRRKNQRIREILLIIYSEIHAIIL